MPPALIAPALTGPATAILYFFAVLPAFAALRPTDEALASS